MAYETPRPDYFPDPIDNQGRWFEDREGNLYKSIRYHGGSVRWVPEGTVMHSGPPGKVTSVYRLKIGFFDKLRGVIKEEV